MQTFTKCLGLGPLIHACNVVINSISLEYVQIKLI